MSEIGEALNRMMITIESRKGANPATSYTASLLSKGPERCAKKFGEEAVEAAIAGALQHKEELITESADTLYHLAVLLAANGVTFADVADALTVREGISGHDEKASR